MRLFSCLLFVLISFQLCERFPAVPIQGRIYGGSDVAPGKWPFYVHLTIEEPDNDATYFVCGGSIISENWILTASHCTVGEPVSGITVDAGFVSSKLSSYTQRVKVQEKYEHPQYNDTEIIHDIALLQLQESLKFDDQVKPILLPTGKDDLVAVGSKCDIIGFGDTDFDEPEDKVQQEAVTYVVSKEECLNSFADVEDSQLCANEPNAPIGICLGDSGGPMACYDASREQHVLRGISSFGAEECGLTDVADVFARVSWYKDWIKEISSLDFKDEGTKNPDNSSKSTEAPTTASKTADKENSNKSSEATSTHSKKSVTESTLANNGPTVKSAAACFSELVKKVVVLQNVVYFILKCMTVYEVL